MLKSALNAPLLYIYNHFDVMKNEVTIACQRKICSERCNRLVYNGSSQIAINNKEFMLDEIKAFEKACNASLVNRQLESVVFDSLTKEILKIEDSLKIVRTTELKVIARIQEKISETMLLLQNRLFLNKTMKFLDIESFLEEKLRTYPYFFGILLVVDGEFISRLS